MNANKTILIAEDDEGHITLIRKDLKRHGITNPVRTFRNGQDILDFLLSHGDRPCRDCIVILDIRMPKVSGIEVLQRIREHMMLKEIPAVIMTTTDNQEEIALCNDLGIAGYVLKSDNFGKLSELIMQIE